MYEVLNHLIYAPIVQRLGFTPSKGEARVRFPVGARGYVYTFIKYTYVILI